MVTRVTYRYVNQITGVFVLMALALAIASVIMASRAHHWFTPVTKFDLVLPEQGSFGLTRGATVVVLGTNVGTVQEIVINDNGRMVAKLSVRRDFAEFIRTGSTATIKKSFGVAGDAYVEIGHGLGSPLPAGASIEAVADRAPQELLQDLLNQTRTEILPAIQEARLAINQYAEFANQLNDPDQSIQQTLTSVSSIAAKIDKGEGLAGRLLADREMAEQVQIMLTKINSTLDEVKQTVMTLRSVAAQLGDTTARLDQSITTLPETMHNVNQTFEEIHAVAGNLGQATAPLPDMLQDLGQQIKTLPGLIIQTQATLREIQRLVEGAQRHWLVRGYMNQDIVTERINPAMIQEQQP